MKKILLVAASVTLLAAGCQKTEIVNPVGEPAMTFSTGMKKLTKASGEVADAAKEGMFNLQAQDFRVWAYGDFEDENTLNTKELDEIYDGMANLNVYFRKSSTPDGSTSTSEWTPNKEYYWPGVGKNLRFFAVSGADLGDDLSTTNNVTIAINRDVADTSKVNPTLTVNNFTVNHVSPNTDLMVADFVRQNQSKKSVNLNFRHALSKVEFLFKTMGGDRKVFVQSLEVTGINTVSTLTVTAQDTTGKQKPIKFEWDEPATAQTFTDDYTGTSENFPEEVEYIKTTVDEEVVNKYPADNTVMELTTSAEPFATWMVIPQTIAAGDELNTDLQVKVIYVIGERQFESIFTLSSDDLKKWGPNQYVRYTITLTPNLITFHPTVDEWDQYDNPEMQN